MFSADQLDMIRLFGHLFEGAHVIFGFKDRYCRYIYVNDEFTRFVGRHRSEVIGARTEDILPPSNARAIELHHNEVMQSGQSRRYTAQLTCEGRLYDFALICFPTRDAEEQATGSGFIGIHIPDRVFSHSDMPDMLEKAQQTILELQKRVDDMRQQATTDPLTGVWNRVQAEIIGRQEMAKQERVSQFVTVAFVDIDAFRKINDSWGSAAGDSILIEFCRAIQNCLRAADVLARWGGEEFLIIMPDTSLDNACIVVERIQDHLNQILFSPGDKLTASFGLAEYRMGENWPQWIERAVQAMQRAKSRGGNMAVADIISHDTVHSPEYAASAGLMRLSWRKSYECGYPLIDEQHRALFAHANNLLSAMMAEKDEDDITTLLDALIASLARHFEDEERILTEAGYSLAHAHQETHARILERVHLLRQRYAAGRQSLQEMFSFLAYDAIALHMLHEDRKFFDLIKKNRIASYLIAEASLPAAKPGKAGSALILPEAKKTKRNRSAHKAAQEVKAASAGLKKTRKRQQAGP